MGISSTSSLSAALATSVFAWFGSRHCGCLLQPQLRASSIGEASTDLQMKWFLCFCRLCIADNDSFGLDGLAVILGYMTASNAAYLGPWELQKCHGCYSLPTSDLSPSQNLCCLGSPCFSSVFWGRGWQVGWCFQPISVVCSGSTKIHTFSSGYASLYLLASASMFSNFMGKILGGGARMKGEGQCAHHIVSKCRSPSLFIYYSSSLSTKGFISCFGKRLVKQFCLFVVAEQWAKLDTEVGTPLNLAFLAVNSRNGSAEMKRESVHVSLNSNREILLWFIWHNLTYCILLHGVLRMCHHLFYKFFFFTYYVPPPAFFITKTKVNYFNF